MLVTIEGELNRFPFSPGIWGWQEDARRMMATRRSKIILASLVSISLLLIVVTVDSFIQSRSRISLENMRRSDSVKYENLEKYDSRFSENGITDTPAMMQPIPPPPMTPAHDMELADDEKVIAIEVGGEHFAYPLTRFTGIGDHIVNRAFHGKPITVAYCDLTDCVRVLSADNTREPLPVIQNGLTNGELALRFHGLTYQLSKDTIPLHRYPFTIVNWQAWFKDHPDGLVHPGIDWEKIMAETSDPRTRVAPEGP